MHKIIEIERYTPSSLFWPNLVKNKKLDDLSVMQILDMYQGFEGKLIAFFLGTDQKFASENAIHNYIKLKQSKNCLLLLIISQKMNPAITEQLEFVGYEVGICEEEKTIYSSIFNEILFGSLQELIAFKDCLNENLLFLNRSLAEQ